MHEDVGGRSDGELLATADADAFAVLVRRHIRNATFLAAQLLGDRDDAEDVVQVAFTIVHRRAAEFDPSRPFAPWLFGIVRRLAANRRARDSRRSRLLRLWGQSSAAELRTNELENRIDARLDAETVSSAMQSLPAMQRACFELVVLRGVPPAEVAAMHDISESTVRQHVFRARRALRMLV